MVLFHKFDKLQVIYYNSNIKHISLLNIFNLNSYYFSVSRLFFGNFLIILKT